jgi:hypothetical protein
MGSYFHANALREKKVQVKLMISLEMIGYFSDENWSQKYPMAMFYLLYPTTGNFISLLARPAEWGVMRDVKSLFMGGSSMPLRSANVPESVPGVSLSDHFNYWNAGFPAMMMTDTAFMRNQNYHQKQDTPEKLNYERMADVVNGVAAVALGL